jgi:hypothetical protein
LLTFFAAAKKVSAAPHRGEANRPITKQGKANTPVKPKKPRRRRQPPRGHYKTLTTKDKTIVNNKVDINGNGYSFPNILSVTSPGIRPIPIFLSHGQEPDKIATAINIVNNHRIIVSP